MRAGTAARVAAHHVKPLVLRGGLARTFGSLVCFLAALFLSIGTYLLGDAFLHPIDAQAVAVLAAAFSITLSIILFFYLLKPRRIQKKHEVWFRRGA